ncbi:MAG: hypothetical protein E7678_05555 [Ruminococcaceae bacterium]|nr:hypothetical protein [Oscillospiraceae bacterium]
MKKSAKKILKVQPLYSIIICFVISICGVVMLLLPTILLWEKSERFVQIIYYTISIGFIILGLFLTLRFTEYAIINDNEIIIKSVFGKIVSFKNHEIKSINMKNLITYDSRGYISLQWIVIKTDTCSLKRGGLNKKSNNFCQFIASQKNMSVLRQYANYYHIPFE